MERRLYFILGDLLACISAGAAAGFFVPLAISPDWFAPLGMILGMVLGMGTGIVCGLMFAPFFGAIETMLLTALTGMVVGMAAPAFQNPVLSGVSVGVACLVFTYLLQARLCGEAS